MFEEQLTRSGGAQRFKHAQLEELWARFYALMFWSPMGFVVASIAGIVVVLIADSIVY